MNYSLMWNGQPSGLTFEQTLDQNEHGEELMLVKLKQRGEMEKIMVERRNEESGVDAEGSSLRRMLMLLMNLNLPGLRKR